MSEEIKVEKTKNKKKLQKSEDFVGWKSNDGLLEVVGLLEKSKHSKFKVICSKCSEDKELFPNGYFISSKSNLQSGRKPCGCSDSPKWTKEQYLVLARRAAKDRFIVHGFSEEFHGSKTKLELECIIDGYRWSSSIDSVINRGSGCPKCAADKTGARCRIDIEEAFEKCREICEIEGYELIGFPEGYSNQKSKFEYKCPSHGKRSVCYNNFVNNGARCRGCADDENIKRIRENGNGNGYYPERKDEQDFLYVLDFDGKFIKVGRSFDVDERIGNLKSRSKIKKIYKLNIFTATHQQIYDTEQEILEELRQRGFQYHLNWTKECFENECLFILNKLLDNSGLEEII